MGWRIHWGSWASGGVKHEVGNRHDKIGYGGLEAHPAGKAVNVEGKEGEGAVRSTQSFWGPLFTFPDGGGGQGGMDLCGARGTLGLPFDFCGWWCGSWRKRSKTAQVVCNTTQECSADIDSNETGTPGKGQCDCPGKTLFIAPQTHGIFKLVALLKFIITYLVIGLWIPHEQEHVPLPSFWLLIHGRLLE